MRITLATYQFVGEAYQWWLFEEESRDIASLTWKQFKSIFLEKYFPPAARQARAAEFFALTQGSDTVFQYEAKFARLSHFAKSMVSDEAMKVMRFVQGFRPVFHFQLAVLNLQTYREAVDRTLLVETELDSQRESQKGNQRERGQRSRPRETSPLRSEKKSRTSSSSDRTQTTGSTPGTPICYQCGQPGHLKRDCTFPPRARTCYNCGQT